MQVPTPSPSGATEINVPRPWFHAVAEAAVLVGTGCVALLVLYGACVLYRRRQKGDRKWRAEGNDDGDSAAATRLGMSSYKANPYDFLGTGRNRDSAGLLLDPQLGAPLVPDHRRGRDGAAPAQQLGRRGPNTAQPPGSYGRKEGSGAALGGRSRREVAETVEPLFL